ncbi:MAG: hypothetical protein H8E41_05135 [Desulfobulbaceae bacterium]|uniref:Uncharacterized protein n=1 Tax=Candidatus Desulfobia pelagia TaxID=2841692 RepID=A0A8J6NDD3_9BACT|nr:hypothetical protein [Candidatus Desulfobia pelagia]
MNTAHAMAKTRSQSKVKASASNELAKVGVRTIGIAAGLIGCWATACLVAGVISSGGPVSLVTNFISAIIR